MEISGVSIVPVHPYSYRRPNMENDGIVTGVYNVKPDNELDYRLCYQITYPDGFIDYMAFASLEYGEFKFKEVRID